MDSQVKSFAIASLRRASYRWPGRYKAFAAAKIGRNQYVCSHCSAIKGRKDVNLDHILPVVDPEIGWVSFDVFIERLFCSENNFQVLCCDCHKKKTAVEREFRLAAKKKEKKELPIIKKRRKIIKKR